MVSAQPTPGRTQAIDAARGAAMLLVFMAHFGDVYWRRGGDSAAQLFRVATSVATPTFLLISGMVMGLLHTQLESDRLASVRARLRDRALFLLVVARPLIGLAFIPLSGWRCFDYVFVTDTIACCVLTGCFLVPRVTPRRRLALGVALVGTTWAVIALWTPPLASGWRVLKEVLFGRSGPNTLEYVFPLVPWLGVYLVGTFLGRGLPGGDRAGTLFRIGAAGVLLAAAAKGVYWAFPHQPFLTNEEPLVYQLTSPLQKEPPGPAYLAFYGGGALAIVAFLLALEARKAMPEVRRRLATLGRTSLFAFVAQYYVYYFALHLLDPRPTGAWPLFLGFSIGLLFWACSIWDRRGYNRFLTLGLGPRPDASSNAGS